MRPTWMIGIALALIAPTVALATQPGQPFAWQGAGVVVTNFNLGAQGFAGSLTVLDNGAVVCQNTDNEPGPDSGTGGACIPFGQLGGDSVLVQDSSQGTQVAFQVCVDNNGDGVCGGPSVDLSGVGGGCGDSIVFSHGSRDGAYHNPLAVPKDAPALFQQCGSQGFPGYIVITCAGAHTHAPGVAASHTHHVTQGTAQGTTTGGTPSDDFCGAPTAAKAYVVV